MGHDCHNAKEMIIKYVGQIGWYVILQLCNHKKAKGWHVYTYLKVRRLDIQRCVLAYRYILIHIFRGYRLFKSSNMGDRARFIYLDTNVPVENKAPEGESDMGLYGVLFYFTRYSLWYSYY